ncbi:hypothetical protein TNCV_1162421 [Trichonephila clavipes]|nr:hypothetical protein TNCV_1162421 [Trichonephila clavipes]
MVRRGCHQFSDGRQQVQHVPRPGRLCTARAHENVKKVDDVIKASRCITIDGAADELGIGHEEFTRSCTTFLDTGKCQLVGCFDN